MRYNPCDVRKDPTFRKAAAELDKKPVVFHLAWSNPQRKPVAKKTTKK